MEDIKGQNLSESRKPRVVILGGGLAGLSSAFHLKKPSMVVEKSNAVGGTARSFSIDGFTFDHTGHLLHLHHPYTKRLIAKLLKGNITLCQRNAWIYSHSTCTPYPFQANTHGLPPEVIKECVLGFINRQRLTHFLGKPSPHPSPNLGEGGRRPGEGNVDYSRLPFDRWCLTTFGEGISKHFMFPYNQKLWQTPLNKMTSDWCGPFVPTPVLADIVKGALTKTNATFGYNASFFYPKKGGIQMLPEAMAAPLKDVRLNCALEEVDWQKRRVKLSSGEWVPYRHLINTMPLLEFLCRTRPLPRDIERAAMQLRWTSVMCLNIGVNRAHISDKSWIYFPERTFPFYRVGFPMNFTPHVVPKGCSSMYVEVSYKPGREPDHSPLMRQVRSGLMRCGILKASDRLPVVQLLPIKYAYVIYNEQRPHALQTIFKFLSKNHISSIGRYGAWKYSFMEEAILDGKAAAEKIDASLPTPSA